MGKVVLAVLLANHGPRRYLWRFFSRRSSAVEHPLRKRVVGGSNPSAGTNFPRNRDFLRLTRSPADIFANTLK
jgi:hypothetical protein